MHQQYRPTNETAFISTSNAENFANDDDDDDNEYEAEDEIANILSLKLKKPKHWKWEISTARSCSNIALPRILLYDHKGNLLVDVNSQDDQVIREPIISKSPESRSEKRKIHKPLSRSSTVNLSHSIRQQLNQEFNELQIDDATPIQISSTYSPTNTVPSTPKSLSIDTSCIDIFTNDLPDYKTEQRSSSFRSVRFKDDPSRSSTVSLPLNEFPTPSQSSGTTPTTSSSGPREKRRYRRSRSSGRSSVNSPSILERFSMNKGRFSSPEFAEGHDVYKPPRYILRTSKAGTLLVHEESFSHCRRRRRLRSKNFSNENLQNEVLMRNRSSSFGQIPEKFLHEKESNLENVSEKQNKRKGHIRRRRSDTGPCTPSSSSEEDFEHIVSRENGLDILDGLRGTTKNYGNLKKRLKGVPLHPESDVLYPYGSPTER